MAGISQKQREILLFAKTDYLALICDGAVRSGKTSMMGVAFIRWAMEIFNGCAFGICGKTVQSTERNVIAPLMGLRYLPKNGYRLRWSVTKRMLTVQRGKVVNYFYVFGGKDEAAAGLIQGITLGGVFLDEVALMPRSFVEQALARCSLEGSRFWFSCNPEGPGHWFYQEWILKAQQRGALHLHFTMEDNPSLSAKMLERYKKLYTGVFYERYILGNWVAAQGLIYTMFDPARHVVADGGRTYSRYIVSCDYGTVNPCSMGLWGFCLGKWYRIREFYFDSRKTLCQKTDGEYYADLCVLCGDLPVERVVVDPSAASFMECIRRGGRFVVVPASNRVLDGIRLVAQQLHAGDLLFCASCVDCVREFGSYRWDEEAVGDKPIKADDHAMDEVRYFVRAVFGQGLVEFF